MHVNVRMERVFETEDARLSALLTIQMDCFPPQHLWLSYTILCIDGNAGWKGTPLPDLTIALCALSKSVQSRTHYFVHVAACYTSTLCSIVDVAANKCAFASGCVQQQIRCQESTGRAAKTAIRISTGTGGTSTATCTHHLCNSTATELAATNTESNCTDLTFLESHCTVYAATGKLCWYFTQICYRPLYFLSNKCAVFETVLPGRIAFSMYSNSCNGFFDIIKQCDHKYATPPPLTQFYVF